MTTRPNMIPSLHVRLDEYYIGVTSKTQNQAYIIHRHVRLYDYIPNSGYKPAKTKVYLLSL